MTSLRPEPFCMIADTAFNMLYSNRAPLTYRQALQGMTISSLCD